MTLVEFIVTGCEVAGMKQYIILMHGDLRWVILMYGDTWGGGGGHLVGHQELAFTSCVL
jgi:hypothetical protein